MAASGADMTTRDDIITAARGWLGTPYRHQASAKGAGCDCLGLVRGVYREVVGAEPEAPPAYAPDWAEARSTSEAMAEAARRHLIERAITDATPGDVLLFRLNLQAVAKHVAILSSPGRMIHAYSGHAVTETSLTPWWARRLAFVFSFPVGD